MTKALKKKLPKGWRLCSLGDKSLVTLIMGQSPPGCTYNKEMLGLPFFQGKKDFGILYPTPTIWCSKPTRIAKPNDILMSVRAPVGPTNIAQQKCCIGRGLVAIRCKSGLTFKYLLFVLRNFEKKISIGGAGSVFDAIGKDEIEATKFPFPEKTEDQIAIANKLQHKLDEVEKMRQAALRQQEAVAAMQGAALREIFPFKEDETLPKGWDWIKLQKVGKLSQGGTPGTDISKYWNGTYPFITGADITDLYVSKARSFLTEKGLSSGKTERCKKGDLLIVSRTRVGRVGIANTILGISQDVSVVKVNNGYDIKYLAIYLKSISQKLENACQGSTIKGLTRDFLENISIPLPLTVADQISIANKLEKRMEEIEKMHQAAEKQVEAVEALPGAILREVFDFTEQTYN